MAGFRGTIYLVGIVLAILGLGPVVLSVLADGVAGWAGCEITPPLAEGPAAPCLIGGGDWGPWLHELSILRWSLAFTLPVGVMGAAIVVLRIGMDLWPRR
jgi:hypothetical protein